MVKGKGKGKARNAKSDVGIRQKNWPLVTSSTCENCEIRCPKGVAYMEQMEMHHRVGRGVVCKKELYLKRKAEGRPLFHDVPRLHTWPQSNGNSKENGV